MKSNQVLIFLIFLMLYTLVATEAIAQQQVGGRNIQNIEWRGQEMPVVEGELFLKIDLNRPFNTHCDILKDNNVDILREPDNLGWMKVRIPSAIKLEEALTYYQNLPGIFQAEPNGITNTTLIPNDLDNRQWSLNNTSQVPAIGTYDADIDAPEAWSITSGSLNVVIVVLDSGIPMQNDTLSHPDLSNPVRVILGPDFIEEDQYEGVKDNFGHGTHVAGIAAAETNNNTGIAGVCWNCKLLIIQIFDGGGDGDWGAIYDGIIYSSNYQENKLGERVVINLSGGGFIMPTFIEDAIVYAKNRDVLIVVSAGNLYGGGVLDPAAFSSNYENIIAVSSTNHHDNFSSFFSQGPAVSLSAPGGYGSIRDGIIIYNHPGNIYSTTPNYFFTLQLGSDINEDYSYMSGTSMAAPHVSGVAALVLSINSTLIPSEIRNILQSSADWFAHMGGSPPSNMYGFGRLNAYKALKYTIEYYGATLGIEKQQVGLPLWEDIAFHENVYLASGSTLTIDAHETVTLSAASGTVTIGAPPPSAKVVEDGHGLVRAGLPHTDSDPEPRPEQFLLLPNYPNPFNPSTTIRYELPGNSDVRLEVYDMLGRRVALLVNEARQAGMHQAVFDASALSSGVYIYRLQAGGLVQTRKMLLIK